MKKAIILAVVLLLAIGAALYFVAYKGPGSRTESGDKTFSKYDETTIPKAIDDLYQNYENCLKNPPSEASGKVGEYCQNNTGLTTANFAANLEKGGTAKAGADPVFCAQSVPESMKASTDFRVKNGKATGFMEEKFGSSQVKPQIELAEENGVWKIDDIVCSAPLVGGDRDEHGCIGSAGYSWCEQKQKCLRIWEESCDTDSAIGEVIRKKLAEKYDKPVSEVNVSVSKSDADHAAGSVLFGQGGPGEGGIFLAVKIENEWQVVFDGNGSIDCSKMRQEYKFSDAILKPNFCD
ncbi:MAG: hypothetical protein WC788_09485 [Candidatus Paceibacterota bacterium]|jgi:hypothetical protein